MSPKASQKTPQIQSEVLTMIKQTAFKPAWYLRNRHLQTILPNITYPRFPKVEKERVELADGDFIDLLWSETRSPQILLILHGLEGSANSPYARRILNYCNQHQIAAVLMHFRGCSGEPNRLLRSYHSGETGDVQQVIEHLKTHGITDIALLGYSLGGNVTVKYMGEGKTDPTVRCAIAVSVPFRLDLCATAMDQGFAKIYQSSLVNRLIVKMQQKAGHCLKPTPVISPIPKICATSGSLTIILPRRFTDLTVPNTTTKAPVLASFCQPSTNPHYYYIRATIRS